MKELTLEELVSYCKTYGFVFQGSEIYGGLANSWDFGPLGVLLKNNIEIKKLKHARPMEVMFEGSRELAIDISEPIDRFYVYSKDGAVSFQETPTVDDIKLESPKIEEKEKANTKIRNNKKKQKRLHAYVF